METAPVIAHSKDVCNLFGYCKKNLWNLASFISQQHHIPNGRMVDVKMRGSHTHYWKDILLAARDTLQDNNTLSPFEFMFHSNVKPDLQSIPLSLLDTFSFITAGTRTIKHAEYKNEKKGSEPCKLGESQNMFLKNP